MSELEYAASQWSWVDDDEQARGDAMWRLWSACVEMEKVETGGAWFHAVEALDLSTEQLNEAAETLERRVGRV